MSKSLRVLFLTKYPIDGASSRYRVFQYLDVLSEHGISSDVSSFFSRSGYRAVFGSSGLLRRTLAVVFGAANRIYWVLRGSDYDLIYMQRELLPIGPPIFERFLKWRNVRMLFDYDDALFIEKPSAVSPVATIFKSGERVKEIFGLVDAVVAGNSWLKEQAERYGAKAYVLEVAEDTKRISMRATHREETKVILGWLGSKSTEKYLNQITPVLQQFFGIFPDARLVVVGGGEFRPAGLPVEHVPWSYETEVAQLHRFDIGLMPLPIEDWSRGKCGGKARTYMAAGVPAVVQNIGYNQELIRHGETGFLMTENNEDWLKALIELTVDSTLRQSIAERARVEVEKRFSLEVISNQLAEILWEEARAS